MFMKSDSEKLNDVFHEIDEKRRAIIADYNERRVDKKVVDAMNELYEKTLTILSQ